MATAAPERVPIRYLKGWNNDLRRQDLDSDLRRARELIGIIAATQSTPTDPRRPLMERVESARVPLFRFRVGSHRVILETSEAGVTVHRIRPRNKDTYKGVENTASVEFIDYTDVTADTVHQQEASSDEAIAAQYVITRHGSGVQVVAPRGPALPEQQSALSRPAVPAHRGRNSNPLTDFFSDDQLRSLAVPPSMIEYAVQLGRGVNLAEALSEHGGFAPRDIEFIAEIWETPESAFDLFESGRIPTHDDLRLTTEEYRDRLNSPDSSTSVTDELSLDEFEGVLNGTIEEWMFYLHPSQARIVRVQSNGPMRVRGGPGTGKTVVGLHRARWIANTSPAWLQEREVVEHRVLVTTRTHVLPRIWEHLFERFAADDAARISAITIDDIAREILSDETVTIERIEDAARLKLLRESLTKFGIDTRTFTPEDMADEIDQFIAGRELTQDQYLTVARRGRTTQVTKLQRRVIWQAYLHYRKALERRGEQDEMGMLAAALERIRAGAGPRFDAVIVDEAQDLTELHLKFLLAIDDSPNNSGLMLIGDGQQRIYPGGFSLREMGIEVRGRSHLLRSNWRNTEWIMLAAANVVGDLPFGDLEEHEKVRPSAEAMPLPIRDGVPARLHLTKTEAQSIQVLNLVIYDLLRRFTPEEIAVLVQTANEVKTIKKSLGDYSTRRLTPPEHWLSSTGITIGRHHHSKGLEFKAVVVMSVDEAAAKKHLASFDDKDDGEALWIRRLFVAMTRARDELDVIATSPPYSRIEAAATAFDQQTY